MAGITFTVEITDKLASDRLAALVDRMARPIGFYKNVGAYLTEVAIPRNFDTQTAPDGTPWAQLRPVTIKRREKAGQTPITILKATGALKASIVSQAGDDGVRVGSAMDQAAVMQFGAAQGQFGAFIGKDKNGRDHFHHLPWGNIPARPYLGLSAEDEVEIVSLAMDWLDVG